MKAKCLLRAGMVTISLSHLFVFPNKVFAEKEEKVSFDELIISGEGQTAVAIVRGDTFQQIKKNKNVIRQGKIISQGNRGCTFNVKGDCYERTA